MKYILIAALAAAISIGAFSLVSADDENGDVQSNCHTGSKHRGAGGNDKGEECGAAPRVTLPTAAPPPRTDIQTPVRRHIPPEPTWTPVPTYPPLVPPVRAPIKFPDTGGGACAEGC